MKDRSLFSFVFIVVLSFSGILNAQDGFRVWPYLQNPASDAITVLWFSEDPSTGQLQYREQSSGSIISIESNPVLAEALAYSNWEEDTFFGGEAPSTPFQHRVRIVGLQPNTIYDYTVIQGSDIFTSSFRTAPESNVNIRFIVYADCETEPESSGSFTNWVDPASGEDRLYLVDQEVGYRNNLDVIRSRDPNLVIIAGDLVESGGEQRDWTDFWSHNTNSSGQLSLGGRVPILAALGNHEYAGGPYLGGYNQPGSENAVKKYLTYFDSPPNQSPNPEQEGRFYSIDYGPATFIVLDVCNNGTNGSSDDTNFYLLGEDDYGGGNAPDFGPNSNQYIWLEEQLIESQRNSLFTFVFFHHSPYSSGPHGYPPGSGGQSDPQSGVPVRTLTPLFLKYGVDAVISGHDEMWERSELHGTETKPDGLDVAHSIQFYDVGIGGDGLRAPWSVSNNDYLEFLVHTDVPEIWQDELLSDGGKHYGHLEVDIVSVNDSTWHALLAPVYIFPVFNPVELTLSGFERRVYDDQIIIAWNSQDPEPTCLNETFTAASGIVIDNSRDEDYMNNADCEKLIQPAGATGITLTFTEFNLENGNDYVRIYDGSTTSDPLLGEFTGTTLPGAITSSDGSMLIHFTSNGSIRAPGWTASYTSNAPACGPCLEETFSRTSGELSDNSCEADYLNDTDCRKLIQPVDADYISLTFTTFGLEAGYDFVRVYDGATTSDPLLGEFSGTSLPGEITSSGGSMLVHFTSDYSVTRGGWSAEYTSGVIEPICINETFTAASGIVIDNSRDEDYMNNADCQKLIQPAGATGITLTFTEFNLENGNDYVRIYDGSTTSDPLLGEFTGTTLPGAITSSDGSMLIHFTSNGSIRAPGWTASYTSNAPACGPCLEETFSRTSGELSDNSCEADYLNDTDCRKLIQPVDADYISLTFTTFGLEAGYDFVRVYDGATTSDPLLGEFSGTSLPGEITSSGGSMLVHFTSDYSVTRGGWSAEYTSGVIEPICINETFTAASGIVIDNSRDEDYMNNADCEKLIQPAGATGITLTFTEFNLENGNDYVRIYDGSTTSDPLLGEFTGTTLPGAITSSDGSMLIHFTSNGSIRAPGWTASYTSNAPACGPCLEETFSRTSGELSDNSCEADYLNDTDCRKLIQPVDADYISLTFTTFGLEAGYDFVRVYDGATTSDPLLGEFSGTSLPGEITSSGGSMLVHFTSDYSVTRGGWSAEYTSGVIEPICINETFTAASGIVIDNSRDEDYMNNADCEKLIQPAGATGITLTFTEFNLENGNDYVRIYDGSTTSDPLLGEFTGTTLPGAITSSDGSMLIHFTSNGSIRAPGWTASYTSNAPACGPCLEETFSRTSGELSDNSCEADYLNDTDCRKLIQPVDADYISLTFTTFGLEAGYDFVRVYDGATTSDPLLGEFSGTSLPGEITSSGGSMLVHFTSDYSVTAQGWEASYEINTTACGPCINLILTESSGVISDNSCGGNYGNYTNCQKLIQPIGADYVALTFTEFDLEAGYDFVRVYDGTTIAAPLLGEFSGTALPGTLTSSGGSMFVHFLSDYSVTAAGWSAEYVTGSGARSSESIKDENLILNSPDKHGLENGFIIYPNPTNGKFTIRFENVVEDDLVLRITDPSGKILLEKMINSDGIQILNEIDFSNKPAGIYFIKLYNTSFRQIGKIVVY